MTYLHCSLLFIDDESFILDSVSCLRRPWSRERNSFGSRVSCNYEPANYTYIQVLGWARSVPCSVHVLVRGTTDWWMSFEQRQNLESMGSNQYPRWWNRLFRKGYKVKIIDARFYILSHPYHNGPLKKTIFLHPRNTLSAWSYSRHLKLLDDCINRWCILNAIPHSTERATPNLCRHPISLGTDKRLAM